MDIDLLLAGNRLPFKQPLPPGDIYGFVSRQSKAPLVEIYPMKLTAPLCSIPILLRQEDGDVILNLQDAYNLAFTRGGYPRRLRYAAIPADVSREISGWALKQVQAR